MIENLTLSLAALVTAAAALLTANAVRLSAAPAVVAVFAIYAANYLIFYWAYSLPSPTATIATLAVGACEGPAVYWLAVGLTRGAASRIHPAHLVPALLLPVAMLLAPADQEHWPHIALSCGRLLYAGFALSIMLRGAANRTPSWLVWATLISLTAIALSVLKLGAYAHYLIDPTWRAPAIVILLKTIGASSVLLALLWWALVNPSTYLGECENQRRQPSDRSTAILSRFASMIEQQQPYLQEDFSLADAAKRLSISPRELSEAINRVRGMSYKAMIRQYRIAHACALLGDPSCGDGVLEIALRSGYATKSVFNSAFKSETGMTPSEYRRLHNSVSA